MVAEICLLGLLEAILLPLKTLFIVSDQQIHNGKIGNFEFDFLPEPEDTSLALFVLWECPSISLLWKHTTLDGRHEAWDCHLLGRRSPLLGQGANENKTIAQGSRPHSLQFLNSGYLIYSSWCLLKYSFIMKPSEAGSVCPIHLE